ncbi:DUF1501 domain-containing protein [Urbifossiella limnaea]|uniref:DUF1501 domain-containing protein n=1 Tax=Urbifossiella limnaea TaxID=2528023 RepID=A0A517XXJ1_9BACT|nr:DUF1501 domain-containing protein [Urbifossiella limnaea]QDU22226.1 hypothetical protein ETAA1_42030 [Urbifossiella limnaea]
MIPTCHSRSHTRRAFLGGLGLSWLTPLATALAQDAGATRRPARSVVVLWMGGGPSQLETFDPKPGTNIAGGTGAIPTATRGVQLAPGLEQLADLMGDVALVRSLVSPEGDHERGTYLLKTGFRPDPTVVHPSLGAIVCHDLPAGTVDIPRHVSILPGQWPARGGMLGARYDAFKVFDPAEKVPDVTPRVSTDRFDGRLADLDVVEGVFAAGRGARAGNTGHRDALERARRLMSSEQLAAFDVSREPLAVRREYGETPFGRGCLAARRLLDAGVRCVEVTLDGWDSHANNHAICSRLVGVLDPAFAALLRDLKRRDTLKDTVVLCVGEFGRTPVVNPLGGRDHWPHGFSAAVAGGGLRGGVVVGETDPSGGRQPADPTPVSNLHATVLQAVGIDHLRSLRSPIGRTFPRSDGTPLRVLLG